MNHRNLWTGPTLAALVAGGLVVAFCSGCGLWNRRWAVQWEREVAADSLTGLITAYDIAPAPDGGVLAVGATSGGSLGDAAVVIRLDSDGREVARRLYRGTYFGQLNVVRVVPAGGYIACGATYPCGWLVRLNESGDTVWTRTWGDTASTTSLDAVTPTADGGYMVAGYIAYNLGAMKVLFARLDATGTELSRWEWAGPLANESPVCLLEQPDGGFLISSMPTTLVRASATGDTLWTRTYGFGYWFDLCPAPGGGWFGAGDSSHWPCDPQIIVTARFDANGETLWTRKYRDGSDLKAYRVAAAPDGGCVVFGSLDTFSQGHEKHCALVLGYSSDGKLEWERTFGSDHSTCRSGIVGTDGWLTLAITEFVQEGLNSLTFIRTRP